MFYALSVSFCLTTLSFFIRTRFILLQLDVFDIFAATCLKCSNLLSWSVRHTFICNFAKCTFLTLCSFFLGLSDDSEDSDEIS